MTTHPALGEAASVVGPAENLAIACHVGPDGDALGSMFGLAIAAQNAGKEVVTSFGSPFNLPGNMSYLPSDTLVAPQDFPEAPSVMVVLDAGSSDRLGELAASASRAQTVVVLDHHVTNEGFGDISVVDPKAAATGEIVFDLLQILGWDLTTEIANCLHTAIVTDTGRFQHSNTTSRTLEIASQLVAAGADTTMIGEEVYGQAPFGYLSAAGAALGRANLDPDRSMVTTVILQADLEAAGIDWGDIDNLIDTLRLAREADVAVIAKVHADGKVKVSMRSRGATDVGSLAASMGGGGHRLAAGFTADGEPEEVLKKIVTVIESYR
jgi:phosphoesterase RecJ-like protein